MKRKMLSKRANKRAFARGNRVESKNLPGRVLMRGGCRL